MMGSPWSGLGLGFAKGEMVLRRAANQPCEEPNSLLFLSHVDKSGLQPGRADGGMLLFVWVDM